MEQLGSNWTDFCEILYGQVLYVLKSTEKSFLEIGQKEQTRYVKNLHRCWRTSVISVAVVTVGNIFTKVTIV
jgi:hypothetical protein